MKNNRKYVFFPLGFMLLCMAYACKKSFLDKQPLGALGLGVIANQTGVEGLLIGTYHMVGGQGGAAGNSWGSAASNWSYGNVATDDAYKGSVPADQFSEGLGYIASWTPLSTNGYLNSKWQAMYDGVQRANDVLRTLPLAKDISADNVKRITGEVRFLRGHFHYELKQVFNYIVYSDEKTITTSNVDASGNFVDYWPKIEADFQAAIDGLPELQPQAGRANKSAAKAYLAKCYMEEHKYALAKPILDDLIANGKTAKGDKYALVNYESNFNGAQDNGAESVWAYQASVNDGSGTNGNYGDNLEFPNGSGPGGCCGFGNPSLNLANAYKTDASTGLPLFDTYNSGNVVNDPAGAYMGTLDPRIDLVMGRPGVPYYDWGVVPKNDWVRSPADNGYFSPKKVVYAKSQVGTVSSTETSFWGPTQMSAINVNIIRFAEILLWAAECETEIGSPATALSYVNMIRARAADPTGWVYSNSAYNAGSAKYATQTTPAGNYLIKSYAAGAFGNKDFARKAILFEERLELALEGKRFFSLRRFEDRIPGITAQTLNAYVMVEKTRPSFFVTNKDAVFTQGKNEYWPLPQQQIDVKNATGTIFLKQNPKF